MKLLYPALLALLSFRLAASAQTTTFTYQGNLTAGGAPATGDYDMRFTLHDTAALTNQVGNATNLAPVGVSNGLFTVTLNFGGAVFDGSARWLQIAIRGLGDTNARVVLSPRQLVTSTPYAIRSISAVSAITATSATILSAPLPGTNVTGTIPLTNLPPNIALLNSNANFQLNVSALQFSGSGAGLFNVPATGLTGTLPDARLSANVALLNSNATFNGTVTATNFAGYGGGLTNVPGRLFDNIPTGSPIVALANTGYLATNDSVPVVITLPASLRVGETVRVSGSGAGGWIIAQNAGQVILASTLVDNLGLNWKLGESMRLWKAIASSSDGARLVAAVNGGYIYTSANFGVNWAERTSPGSRNWQSVASSANGSNLVAVANNAQIYTSADSGGSWSPRDISRGWIAVASSVDGTHLVAAVTNGAVYTSVNSGANWIARTGAASWKSVDSSATGSNLVATIQSGQIYVSTNAGASWTARGPSKGWTSVASSADGSLLVAGTGGAEVYISTDFGVNWGQTSLPTGGWTSVAASADGSKLAAAISGALYISTDSGGTWFTASGIAPATPSWTDVAISGDGGSMAAVATMAQIYVSSQATMTTAGTAGYLTGTRLSAIELEYIGNGQFMPVTRIGTIRAH